ncbi:hypothetical protein C2857_002715 [Epichloe festucae Fl1]|uniref:BTB domain-containing protein n=1 Tax=Epichloe festucae (strain Fl1) TaxID=877507 RepID=A0A7S9KKK1_EPIFF|nr:hypothetical protein C2857_002715 [Epichloe festucae Fl1]
METAKIRVFRNECLDFSGRSLEVIVGETSFHVNEKLICAASPFFDTAFGGEWNESKTRSIELTEHDAQVFRTYMHWLYLDKLAVRNDAPGFVGNEEYIHLAKAYVLGDFLSDGQFKDAVMDAILEKSTTTASDGRTWYPVGPVIRHIYDNTLGCSEARKLLVDIYTLNGHGAWLQVWADPDDLPKEFLLDLAVALLDKRSRPKPATPLDPCRYHQHKPNQTCYKNRKRTKEAAPPEAASSPLPRTTRRVPGTDRDRPTSPKQRKRRHPM